MSERQQESRNLHYIHRLDYSLQERLTGLFILGAIVLLVLGLLFNQQSSYLFEDTFELRAYMKNAQGISNDTRVKVAGVEVGHVTRIDVSPDNRIEVTLRLRERFHELIRADAVASLNKLSMLGTATIDIDGGSPASPPITADSVIAVEESPSMDELIANVTPALESLADVLEQLGSTAGGDGTGSIRQLLQDSGAAVANLRTISQQLAEGEGLAGRMLNDREMGDKLDASMDRLERMLAAIEQRANELEPVIADSARLGNELPEIASRINELTRTLALTLEEVNSQLDDVPELMTRTQMLMEQADRTMNAVQNTWPISGSLPPEEEPQAIEVQPPND